jgi:hypothetical protein
LAVVGSSACDPSDENFDFFVGKLLVRGHFMSLVSDRRDEQALLGLGGNDCRAARATDLPSRFRVEDQSPFGFACGMAVASQATLLEDG